MQRREFIKSVTAGAAGLLASRGVAAVGTEQRFGDLLVRQPATDHYELLFTPTRPRPLRLLHLTDTHFHPGDETNRATEQVLRAIIAKEQPDFIVHTGDFVNNDSKKPVDWVGMDVMNGLNVPWTLCFGNHDYPVNGAEGSLPLDAIRQKMEHGFQGFTDDAEGRHYCYRYDLLTADAPRPQACLFFFQVGYAAGTRRISDTQLNWFERQLEHDRQREVAAPITVFVHIPLVEYQTLFESGKAEGQRGEKVCFDSDTGRSFALFSQSRRVTSVFCGHDHVNNFHGLWQGTELVYGRVSGMGGYGPPDWQRGGRLISLDLGNPSPAPRHVEVFG